MSWIGVHLGALSLEAFAATLTPAEAARPVALMHSGPGAAQIAHANASAKARGVRQGMKRATALALAPDLLIGQACVERNAQALSAVAQALLGFTPMVTLEAGFDESTPTLLANVASTLTYWGGRGRTTAEQWACLLQTMQHALAGLGHTVQMAVAPTALGAAWLARRSQAVPASALALALANNQPIPVLQIHSQRALAQALDASPVWLAGPGREHWEALQGMGLRTLGDLRGLPRSGMARRFGDALLDELDRAHGHRPDPREAMRVPEHFRGTLELFHRADTTADVLPGAQVLLARLVAWLQARQARARRFVLVMHHEPTRRLREDGTPVPEATELAVALAEPATDAKHLRSLLDERLARLVLPAPTLELALHCQDVVQQAAPNGELFPTTASQREGLARLIERLQARLGPDGVQRPRALDEHRPERATAWVPANVGADASSRAAHSIRMHTRMYTHTRANTGTDTTPGVLAGPRRPVWLVEPAEPLRDTARGPQWQGEVLQLLSGPERLETGWWDDGFVERDYFIAQAANGLLLWIFRLRRPMVGEAGTDNRINTAGWFLQGRFG